MHAIIRKVVDFWSFTLANRFLQYELTFIALVVRLLLLPQASLDLYMYMSWYDNLTLNGAAALATSFSGYTPPYEYLLYFATKFYFLPSFISIKLISTAIDFAGAWVVLQVVRLKYPTGNRPYAAFFATLFALTVFVNSAYWAQSDIIYTTCLLSFLYFVLKDKPFYAMLCFSIGFSFKIQSIIISPFILLLLLKHKIPWRYLLLPPLVYLAVAIPTLLVGRPINELLLIYGRQAEAFRDLSRNAPNLYEFLPNNFYDLIYPLGAAVAALLALTYALLSWRSKTELTANRLVLEATAVLFLMPFILPKMHDRYFYPAALFAIVLAFYLPRYKVLPFALQASSGLSYLPFLKGYPPFVVEIGAVINTLAILWLLATWLRGLYPRAEVPEQILVTQS